jgi:hypothetical protein
MALLIQEMHYSFFLALLSATYFNERHAFFFYVSIGCFLLKLEGLLQDNIFIYYLTFTPTCQMET